MQRVCWLAALLLLFHPLSLLHPALGAEPRP
jgi:hypothetical protein